MILQLALSPNVAESFPSCLTAIDGAAHLYEQTPREETAQAQLLILLSTTKLPSTGTVPIYTPTNRVYMPISQTPWPTLRRSSCLILANPIGGKWYLLVYLHFPVTEEAEIFLYEC